MPGPCTWCGASTGEEAPCEACRGVLCAGCLGDAVAEMERRGLPDEVACPFCAGALPDLAGLVEFARRELKVTTTGLAWLWRESRREDV